MPGGAGIGSELAPLAFLGWEMRPYLSAKCVTDSSSCTRIPQEPSAGITSMLGGQESGWERGNPLEAEPLP